MPEPTTTTIPPAPKLFIAENNPAMLELLPAALNLKMPEIEMDLCWSSEVAVEKLEHTHYDIVVANVRMAEPANFFLLRHHLHCIR